MLSATQIKEQVSLVGLLARLGFQPLRTAGRELLYLSMIRDSDTNPSFSVNEELGVWYDHGLGKGGNIIDFGLAFWQIPFSDVLEKIVQITNTPLLPITGARKRSAVKIPHYELQEIKDLGNNSIITDYLQSRCVWEAAQGRLKEIYYYVEDQKKLRKQFFAAGWQNEFGAWEVRNQYFKGCLGHKAMTIISGDQNKLAVFEGYLNYLSWLTENPQANDSIIVLNSIALIQGAIRKAKAYENISLFFDRDPVGQGATLEFKKAVPQATDCSHHYLHHNDYNDKLRAGQ